MNLDDLRRELRTRAAEPGTASMDDRLAGVRSKVATARRRKAVASGAAALASLAVIGAVAGQVLPGGGGDVADGEFAPLPDQLNGDLLIEAEYNEPGASRLRWEGTLENRNVVATTTCQVPEGTELPNPDLPLMLSWAAGSAEESSQCGELGSPDAHTTVVSSRAGWRDAGVRADDPFVMELALEQGGEAVEVPEARFGLGLYARTVERIREDGVELPVLRDIEDERYRIADHKIRPLGDGRTLRMRTPEVDGQIAVVYGWQSDQPSATIELRQDGEPLRSGYGGSVEGPVLIDGDTSHLLRLQAGGASTAGTLVLAYYVLDD